MLSPRVLTHIPLRAAALASGLSRCGRALAALALFAATTAAHAQTWTRLANNAPGGVNLMLLLSDGTVLCEQSFGGASNGWFKLTPNSAGSYINGTWSTLASAHDSRLYFASQVLTDGRVFVAGGEYGTGGARAEIYDPQANTWTQINPPAAILNEAAGDLFYDCNSEILPDGRVLLMPVIPRTSGIPVIYNPATNSWSNASKLFRGTYQDEASWVKLPDDSILTIDPFGTNSERYIPATNSWVNDATVPVSLYDSFGFELGGAVLLPNGKALFLGATGHTALYTPSGNTTPGTWAAGPDIPGSHGTPDAPACSLVTGNVLCAVSPLPTSADHFPSPTTFYEYVTATNSFVSVGAPGGGTSDGGGSYTKVMLALPTGQVLYSHFGTDLYVYTPSGAPLAAAKPLISSINSNGDGSYHIVGTGLNGINEGATYGDDQQMNSNYPLVRLTRNGTVFYCRTYNWSSTSVATGNRLTSVEFRPPANLPAGTYSLVVVANGVASDATTFPDGVGPPICPSITLQPVSHAVCENDIVSFTVAATGLPTPAYQWRHAGVALSDGGNVSGSTTSTLTISPPTTADAGAYTCLVSNGCGSIESATAMLQVTPAWAPLGSGTDGTVQALASRPNGHIIAAGRFINAGGMTVTRIAEWDGQAWSGFGSGFNNTVNGLLVLANGDVIAGGAFTASGATTLNHIARWDGVTWQPLGSGLNSTVFSIVPASNGDLIAGGSFTASGATSANRVARWNGSSWAPLGTGTSGTVNSVLVLANGDIVVGGTFVTAGGVTVSNVARFSGGAWSGLGVGFNGSVPALRLLSNGNIVAGGSFSAAGGVSANNVAVWNGSVWSPLGLGTGGSVASLVTKSNGDLIVGGGFTTAGGANASHVAVWDGSAWSALGAGIGGTGVSVPALVIGAGGELYAGGSFTLAGGIAASNIARFQGGPLITAEPTAQAACGSLPVVLSVAAQGDPLTYLWKRNGVAVSDSAGHVSGSLTATLTITSAVAADAGVYTCSVTNPCGTTLSAGAQVDVGGNSCCALDYNVDGSVNPDDLGDFITDYFAVPAAAGPGGYAIACPANAPPYNQGYKAGFTSDGAGQCSEPNPDNLGDFITAYFQGC